jgi:hypothetical protein
MDHVRETFKILGEEDLRGKMERGEPPPPGIGPTAGSIYGRPLGKIYEQNQFYDNYNKMVEKYGKK